VSCWSGPEMIMVLTCRTHKSILVGSLRKRIAASIRHLLHALPLKMKLILFIRLEIAILEREIMKLPPVFLHL